MSLPAAVGLIVANMIGTGAFTTLGFQLQTLHSGGLLLLLWGLGGLLSLCGALCYAELGASLGRSGGEFAFLGAAYGRLVGFLAGWVSVTAGFPAPAALAAMALGSYLHRLAPALPARGAALAVLAGTALLQARARSGALAFQNLSTLVKVALMLGLIGAAALAPAGGDAGFALSKAAPPGPVLAQALVFVMYAYSGWNATAYLAGELRDPSRTLPRSALLGVALVTALYLGLQWSFLRAAPMARLKGRAEVALVAAEAALGPRLGALAGGAIAAMLVSSVGALLWLGPRVLQAMAREHPALRALGRTSPGGVPTRALLLQTGLAMALAASGTYPQVLLATQAPLLLCTLLAAAAVIVLRRTRPGLPRPYRAWGYPVTPALFAGVTLWMLVAALRAGAGGGWLGLAVVGSGLLCYRATAGRRRQA